MTDTSEPTIDWATAPQQFREAFERNQQTLQAERERGARADQLERENAMLRAGVDPNHPAAEIFTAGYTGKLDIDDVKAAWASITGATPAAGAPPVNPDGSDPAVVAQLQDLQNQQQQLGTNGVPTGEEPSADPQEEMKQTFIELRGKGRNREQAFHQALDVLGQRAAEGDERVASAGAPGVSAAQQSVQKWREKQGFE